MVALLSALIYVSFFALITCFIRYSSRDLHQLQYLGVASGAVAAVGVWLLDESPLWLLRNGKVGQAEAVLRRMYEINGMVGKKQDS
jgi:hypothetical protein